MAIDPSFLTGTPPPATPLLAPWEIQARQIGIQNALAAGQLQRQNLQENALKLGAMQHQMQGEADIQDWYKQNYPLNPPPAAAPGASIGDGATPAGVAAPAAAAPGAPPAAPMAPGGQQPHELSDDQIRGALGLTAGNAMISARANTRKVVADTQELQDKSQKLNTDYWGHVYDGLEQSQYAPGAVQGALSQAAADGKANTPQFQQLLTAARASDPNALATLGRAAIAQSNEVQDLRAKRKTDQATIDKDEAEAGEKKRVTTLQRLSDATTPAEYQTIYNSLKPGEAASVNAPDPTAWNKNTPALLKYLQLTGEQAATQARETARNQQQAKYENGELSIAQGNLGLRAAEVALAKDRLSYEQQGGGAVDDPAYIMGVVRGEIKLNPRDKNYARVSAAAKNIDPSWSSDRYDNRAATTHNFASGAMSRKLDSINQGISHLGELKAASDDLGDLVTAPLTMVPGAGLINSKVKRYNNAADTAGAELATMFQQGQATQGETHQVQGNLASPIKSVQREGIQGYGKLIGGRARDVAHNYSAGTGDAFPVDQFFNTEAIKVLKDNGVDLYKIADQEKPNWMKAKTMAPPAGGGSVPGGGGAVTVTDPRGVIHLFPNQATADNFKRAAGL